MRYRVNQGEQTPWEIDHQHIRFFVYGAWVQNGGSIEEAGRVVEWLLDELRAEGKSEVTVFSETYTFTSI